MRTMKNLQNYRFFAMTSFNSRNFESENYYEKNGIIYFWKEADLSEWDTEYKSFSFENEILILIFNILK